MAIETESENLGPSIKIDDSIHAKSTVSNYVINLNSLQANNGKEDFVERIEEIDKELERFEITEKVGLGLDYKDHGWAILGL